MKTLKLIIFGKVQGVGYRYYTRLYANEIGIKGTVKNQLDGTVIVYASGNEEQCELFLEKLYKGSPFSKVSHIEIETIDFIEYTDFDVL